jgi:uncharacterized membrane protein YcfT
MNKKSTILIIWALAGLVTGWKQFSLSEVHSHINNFQIFKFSNFAMAVFAPFALFAQVDRTHAPNPGPAPIVKVGNPATFVLPNGLKVYVVQNSKLPKVTASLSLDYDPIIEGDKAGYTEIAGSLMGEGTKTKANP